MDEVVKMEKELRYGAVIAAAGVSVRMGKFKPMLRVGGESIIQRIIRMMREAGADPIIVVTGYRRDILEEHLRHENVMFIYNENYSTTKMMDSVAMGLRMLEGKCDRVIFSPGDIPMVKNDTIQILKKHEGVFVRPVYHGKKGHPVILDAKIIPGIIDYHGKGGLRNAIEQQKIAVTDIPVDDEGVIMDVDTKGDYRELLRQNSIMIGEKDKLRAELNISMGTDEMFFDKDMATFLELIAITGSMSSACQAMNISYTTGWKMINLLEKKLNRKILLRNVGGSEGGGSRLSEEGEKLLTSYNKMVQEMEEFGRKVFFKYFRNQEEMR